MLTLVRRFIRPLLYFIGFFTFLSPFLQFILPAQMLQLSGNSLGGDAGYLFYFRHWGLMAACYGGLLMYVGKNARMRVPVITAAGLEKLGLVYLVVSNWNEAAIAPLRVAAMFDGTACLIFVLYILALRRDRRAQPIHH